MSYKIRKATNEDKPAIEFFYHNALHKIDPQETSWIPGVYHSFSDAEAAILASEFYICINGEGLVVATVILNNKKDEEYNQLDWTISDSENKNLIVHTLITHPDILRQGIGTLMVDFIKSFATETNSASIQLDTLYDNKPARKLYEKNGFSYVGRANLHSFDDSGYDDCVFYEYVL